MSISPAEDSIKSLNLIEFMIFIEKHLK